MSTGKKRIVIIVATIVIIVLAGIGIAVGIRYFQQQEPARFYNYDSNTCTYPKKHSTGDIHYDKHIADI